MKKFWKKFFKQKGFDKNYIDIVRDLIENSHVLSMDDYFHHRSITCLEHSVSVSYKSYKICKKLGLDYKSAARGGLLHDFYLYDWRIRSGRKNFHGPSHPYVALENANKHFSLNSIERDIIEKHMWPLTARPPRYIESVVVTLTDKYCACLEIIYPNKSKHLDRLKEIFQY